MRDLAAPERFAEAGILAPSAGQNAEEPAPMLVEIGHVLGGGQLAVGHVEEVATAGQLGK